MPKRDATNAPGAFEVQQAKKARTEVDQKLVDEILTLSPETLNGSSKEFFATKLEYLQAAYRELQASPPSEAPKVEDPLKVSAMADKLADMMRLGITKQMKWQPSCKTGGKRWSYSSMVQSAAVFYKLFNLEEEKKVWKQKKIPLAEFERITGELSVSIRYGYLQQKGDITLKWDCEENSFTVSGLYGL